MLHLHQAQRKDLSLWRLSHSPPEVPSHGSLYIPPGPYANKDIANKIIIFIIINILWCIYKVCQICLCIQRRLSQSLKNIEAPYSSWQNVMWTAVEKMTFAHPLIGKLDPLPCFISCNSTKTKNPNIRATSHIWDQWLDILCSKCIHLANVCFCRVWWEK